MAVTDEQSSEIDISVPQSARIWNYWLGGKDNYPADRAAGDEVLGRIPDIAVGAQAERAFLVRVVRHLVGTAGIRQFLDVGTGLPTMNNTHEVAQALDPGSRVVYVDNDPLVLVHARALLTGTAEGSTAYIQADLREPDTILAEAAHTLDFRQPVGLMLLGVVNHILRRLRGLRRRVPLGQRARPRQLPGPDPLDRGDPRSAHARRHA